MTSVSRNGQIWALPYAMENLVLYRNTDAAPAAPATVEELVSTGQAAVKKGTVERALALPVGQEGDAYHMHPFFTSGGGWLFAADAQGQYDPTEVGIGTAESIAAARKIAALGKDGSGVLSQSIDGTNAIAQFTAGNAGYLVSGPWALADIRKSGVPYDISPVPPFKGGRPAAPFLGVQAFWIMSNAKNPTFAEEFVTKTMNTPEAMTAMYEQDPRPPVRSDVLTTVSAKDADMAKLAAGARNATLLPDFPFMAGVWPPLGQAYAAIVGGADPATTMRKTGKTIQSVVPADDRGRRGQGALPGHPDRNRRGADPGPRRRGALPVPGRRLGRRRGGAGDLRHPARAAGEIPRAGHAAAGAVHRHPGAGTLQLSTTNYGDGTRTTKEQTIARILGNSVVQTESSPQFNLSVATSGRPATGPFTFFLVDQATGEAFSGTEDGLRPLAPSSVSDHRRVRHRGAGTDHPDAPAGQRRRGAAARVRRAHRGRRDPPARGARGLRGPDRAGYDEASDTITDSGTGVRYTPQRQGDREYFVDQHGTRLAEQSWRADVGLDNYRRALTDPRILSGFLRIFAWTVAFATGSVVLTFAVGLGLAVMLNDPRVRGQRLYRSILLLPYAVPGFISILIWSGFYNQEYGLINELTGLTVNWLGDPWWARVALLLTNLWLGFPYMFLVATGALQAIPAELKEAATIDGAGGLTGFRRITFPLLLVAVAPILVATFAFNFNNYNVIELLTHGGPFTPDNLNAGATDILISYTVRLAFGAGGAQFGFASAIATLLFVITGVLAAAQFRTTRRLEEVG